MDNVTRDCLSLQDFYDNRLFINRINNAKNMLWEIRDEDLVGKLVRRQGSAKQQHGVDVSGNEP